MYVYVFAHINVFIFVHLHTYVWQREKVMLAEKELSVMQADDWFLAQGLSI